MPESRTVNHYGTISRWLHWLMAFLMIGMLVCGLSLSSLSGDLKAQVIGLHKSFGITLLALAAFRLFWRSANPPPALPVTMAYWMQKASAFSHVALYFLMFFLPLTGWLMVSAFGRPVDFFGIATIPGLMEKDREWGIAFREWHEMLAYGLIALLFLHVGAALYHHFIRKDDIFRRMWKG